MVKGKTSDNHKNIQSESIQPKSAGISVLHCDILDNDDLERLSQTIQDTFNGIDIVIDNATKSIFEAINKDDCRAFIDSTSAKLRTTINVSKVLYESFISLTILIFDSMCFLFRFNQFSQILMHFIPKLKYSNCGHFVTIQPILSNQKPLLSSYHEIKELINLLSDNQQSTFALDFFNKQKIRLTTVLWDCDDATNIPAATNGHNNNNNNSNNNGQLDIGQISERILDGICLDRSVVHINKSINPIASKPIP